MGRAKEDITSLARRLCHAQAILVQRGAVGSEDDYESLKHPMLIGGSPRPIGLLLFDAD